MDVSILVFSDCTVLGSLGPWDILRKAGELHAQLLQQGGPPIFQPRLVAVGENPVVAGGGLPVRCDATIDEVRNTDLVVVPALDLDVETQLAANYACVPWLRLMYEAGADLASVCTGAFLLAEAGLLDGKSATTHWSAADLFRGRYPRVTLRPQQLIVDEGRVCTGGGATSFLNLMLYLVEKFCGWETAHMAAKVFLIDTDKAPQTVYAILIPQKRHGDAQILAAQEHIERNISDSISVDWLAASVAMSRRHFIRRFKSATGNTPLEYIQRVRVEAAKKALERSNEPLATIVRQVGYEDMGSFRKLFRRTTGIGPQQYRRKYTLRPALWTAPARDPS